MICQLIYYYYCQDGHLKLNFMLLLQTNKVGYVCPNDCREMGDTYVLNKNAHVIGINEIDKVKVRNDRVRCKPYCILIIHGRHNA